MVLSYNRTYIMKVVTLSIRRVCVVIEMRIIDLLHVKGHI
jgi:hypothetical protein